MSNFSNTYAQFIKSQLGDFTPELALILGSGLGNLSSQIQNPKTILYSSIPDFPQSTVAGHKGQFVFGTLGGKKVLCMQGRFHLYEGYAPSIIAEIIKSFKLLGIKNLIVTNAAGSLRQTLPAGSIMLISDHINFCSRNPLIGPNDDSFGPRFPDMSNAYDKNLQQIALNVAKEENITVQQGVYLMVTGPNFETSAEIKAFRILGADAVGMSTVPEVISAAYCGINVLGFSVITNLGTGLKDDIQTHDETLKVAQTASANLAVLINKIIERI